MNFKCYFLIIILTITSLNAADNKQPAQGNSALEQFNQLLDATECLEKTMLRLENGDFSVIDEWGENKKIILRAACNRTAACEVLAQHINQLDNEAIDCLCEFTWVNIQQNRPFSQRLAQAIGRQLCNIWLTKYPCDGFPAFTGSYTFVKDYFLRDAHATEIEDLIARIEELRIKNNTTKQTPRFYFQNNKRLNATEFIASLLIQITLDKLETVSDWNKLSRLMKLDESHVIDLIIMRDDDLMMNVLKFLYAYKDEACLRTIAKAALHYAYISTSRYKRESVQEICRLFEKSIWLLDDNDIATCSDLSNFEFCALAHYYLQKKSVDPSYENALIKDELTVNNFVSCLNSMTHLHAGLQKDYCATFLAIITYLDWSIEDLNSVAQGMGSLDAIIRLNAIQHILQTNFSLLAQNHLTTLRNLMLRLCTPILYSDPKVLQIDTEVKKLVSDLIAQHSKHARAKL